ncbi:hypothetical protein C3920_13185 [Novacetimonas pomaceti]|uniref:Uncharacterized protein n=1 Tax=Novacetimonas pomaceti TaxID=2021998 RepID=A0ABX5NZ80_9PROT|nr:hypothetical protein C3920_13185 [Novacetimonas pomaceti]
MRDVPKAIFRFPDPAGIMGACVLMACRLWKTPANMLLTSCQECRVRSCPACHTGKWLDAGVFPEGVHPKGNGEKIERFV